MSSKVKQVAKDDALRVKAIAQDAAVSGAYLYPFRGILYFLSHRDLWKPLSTRIAPTLTLGVGVTTAMAVFTYLPQAAALAVVNGPFAAISTIFLVLSESSTLVNILSKTLLVEDALIDTFDGTLLAKDQSDLVSNGRQVKSGRDPIGKLGKLVKRPFAKLAPTAIIRYLILLPLNLIPIVGTGMFIMLQGRRLGPSAHDRYFQLKQWNPNTQDQWIEKNKGAYTGFGIAAVLLELVPVAGILFTFTNTVGAALWAADLERREHEGNGRREEVS
ncbi:MAG: hypothetical protein M1828_006997 [Chrysothrix sp. TS-e1954]|nr:MAG: hypothetical protein M1828_006997 [Chrysothrix sp. TS-e1954]